ncbi:hypothetical protein D3C75_1197200 [compost metagenome]
MQGGQPPALQEIIGGAAVPGEQAALCFRAGPGRLGGGCFMLLGVKSPVSQLHRFGRNQILRYPHPLGQGGCPAAQGVAAGIVQPGVVPCTLLA